VADTTTDDTRVEGQEAADVPVAPLSDHLRQLRDHLLAAFPAATATAYRDELTLHVDGDGLVALLEFARTDDLIGCELLSDVSAVHWPAGVTEESDQETTGWPSYTEVNEDGRIELDYILRSVRHNHWFRVRVEVPDTAPVVPSAASTYSSANFMEREVHDLMGVEFVGHPNMARIMMPDDWEGHPHRKDYPLGGVEVMYKGQTVPPPDEREY
jgi:NADH-quinone oxidoreductase subunit C